MRPLLFLAVAAGASFAFVKLISLNPAISEPPRPSLAEGRNKAQAAGDARAQGKKGKRGNPTLAADEGLGETSPTDDDPLAVSRSKKNFKDQFLKDHAAKPAPKLKVTKERSKWDDSLSGIKIRDDLIAAEEKPCTEERCAGGDKEALVFGVIVKPEEPFKGDWHRGDYDHRTPALYLK